MQLGANMPDFKSDRVLAVGEAMVELAPAGGGLYRQAFAGDTFNTIWHMAQLLQGRARTGIVTCLGTDSFSERFAAEMTADGLDTSGLLRDPERTMGLYLIELDGAERSFHYWRKDSAARRLADDRQALDENLAGAGLINISGITLAILAEDARANLFSALEVARRAGSIISFDPNVRPRLWPSPDACRRTLSRMLHLTDIALPSFDDESSLWGDESPQATIERLRRYGIAEIAVKNGPAPANVWCDGDIIPLPTPAATDVRDTTGAGDSFNAGYLAARFLGATIRDAVALAQKLSALVLSCPGARADKTALARLRETESILPGD